MRKSLIILILTTTVLCSYGQSGKSTLGNDSIDIETVDSSKMGKSQKALAYYPDTNPDAKFKRTDSSGIVVTIQNSGPRGGPYTDPSGNRFGLGIFWTRVINETISPLQLAVKFPTDSLAVSPQSDSHIQLFLPPGTMTREKESLFGYGVTDLDVETGLNKPSMLQIIIQPKEEYLFNIGMLMKVPEQNGPVRAGFLLKGQDLFYRVNIAPFASLLIPCGQIILKN